MGAIVLREQSISDQVLNLADDYAAAFLASMVYLPSDDALRQALSGAFLSYLGDALTMVGDE